ncbi:MAG: class I SAM-dependent methyltransferase [Pseudomonadota bacterium]
MAEHGSLAAAYRPNHDENARQQFVGALKAYLNGPLEGKLAADYDNVAAPAYAAEHGHAPADRDEGRDALSNRLLYQLWGATVFTSQDLMWETVNDTCCRVLPEFQSRRAAIDEPIGSLTLNPDLELPTPIRDVEIHRQPGGYFDSVGDSLLTGLRYFGTVELYRAAKGLSTGAATGAPGMGFYLLEAVKRRFGDIQPKRILDLGCGPGTETVAFKLAFPDAEVHGVDLSAPLLNFAHTWAEDNGHAIHFRQADARDTGFEAGSFDLIVSNILFHETWHDIVPGIMREAHRLLAPGGVFLNGDTPYQPGQIPVPKQVTNNWQVVNNGEPFWTGFADMRMADELIAAGFDADNVFADYDPLGSGVFHIFGARAPGGGA